MIDQGSIERLERDVEVALETGDESALCVLGYGEITLVLGWPPPAPEHACKRWPPFPTADRAAHAAALLERYLGDLRSRGVDAVETNTRSVTRVDGTVVAYAIQPVLPAASIGHRVLRDTDPDVGHPLVDAIVEAVTAVVDADVGLDAQVSNWAWIDGRLRYFDVTTPFLRDSEGRTALDLEVFLRSLPWVLRRPFERFALLDAIERFHQVRPTLVDLCGNLLKERLDRWLPAFLAAANERVDEPITQDEVRRFYRGDARTWATMQRIRRADRWWQRRVRRRPYEFLLPPGIER